MIQHTTWTFHATRAHIDFGRILSEAPPAARVVAIDIGDQTAIAVRGKVYEEARELRVPLIADDPTGPYVPWSWGAIPAVTPDGHLHINTSRPLQGWFVWVVEPDRPEYPTVEATLDWLLRCDAFRARLVSVSVRAFACAPQPPKAASK